MSTKTETIVMALTTVAIIAVTIGVVWFKAGVEARTYNRLTGQDLTQWEAVWVNTRIDCTAPAVR